MLVCDVLRCACALHFMPCCPSFMTYYLASDMPWPSLHKDCAKHALDGVVPVCLCLHVIPQSSSLARQALDRSHLLCSAFRSIAGNLSSQCFCRHSGKRKLAKMSEAAAMPNEKLPHRRNHHVASSSRSPQAPAAPGAAHACTLHDTQDRQTHATSAARQYPVAGNPAADMDATAAELSPTQPQAKGAGTANQSDQQPGVSEGQPAHKASGDSQHGAASDLRHCRSLRSVADAAHTKQAHHSHAESGGRQAAKPAQHAQHEADSLTAQHAEACVASSKRLEQPTASTGTSRPAPLTRIGTATQASRTEPLQSNATFQPSCGACEEHPRAQTAIAYAGILSGMWA